MTEQNEDLSGKTAIVTGATGGIGKEIARGLATMGATVIVGARTEAKGKAAVDDISGTTKSKKVEPMIVDVSSVASVRAFVADFEKKHDALHVLVNNAGAWFSDRRESVDGHELTLATNVLGPYLLTKLLSDRLRASAPSRVVNIVSSIAGNYDPTDLEWKTRKFDGFKVYAQSKQAMRMLSWIFAGALEKDKVTVNAAAPGFVKTDFNQHASGFTAAMIGFFSKIMADSPAKGAETPLWVASASELAGQTNQYFEKRKAKDGKFHEAPPLTELERLCESMTA